MLDGVLNTRDAAVLRKITTKIEKILYLVKKFSLSWIEELNYRSQVTGTLSVTAEKVYLPWNLGSHGKSF